MRKRLQTIMLLLAIAASGHQLYSASGSPVAKKPDVLAEGSWKEFRIGLLEWFDMREMEVINRDEIPKRLRVLHVHGTVENQDLAMSVSSKVRPGKKSMYPDDKFNITVKIPARVGWHAAFLACKDLDTGRYVAIKMYLR